jgi:alpha-beta hydrolase superfamily lysophospholipase
MAPPALLHNFRAKAFPKSSTFINVYGVFATLYALQEFWSLILAHLSTFIQDNLVSNQWTRKKATTTTTMLFGQTVTLDIDPSEFPSPTAIAVMEARMPSCCEHGWFQSTLGYQLHYRYFLPETTKPKAIVVWIHGLQGWGGEAHTNITAHASEMTGQRKTNMALQAEMYLKEGYAVYAMDMMGHGYSEGTRWYMPNGQVMLADFLRFIQKVTSNHDQHTPLFLSGYSYGGCLALKAATFFQDHPRQAPKGFQGVLLQAPAIYDLECFFLFPLIAWAARNLVNPLLGANFRPPVWCPNRVHPCRFWRDPERYRVGMQYDGMNSAGRHIPMQTCLTLVEDMITLRNNTIPALHVPFCVVHGNRDLVVPATGSRYLQRASLTPKEEQALLCFPNALHDMLAEPEANAVMAFQVKWIKDRLACHQNYESEESDRIKPPQDTCPSILEVICGWAADRVELMWHVSTPLGTHQST